MADYFSQAVFQPSIPKHLITDEDRHLIEAFGITLEADGDRFYLYAEDWCTSGILDAEEPKDDQELYEDDLFARFQEIIRRSDGELTWITKEHAYTCSRMRPDGFGGGAIFITADDIQYCSTSMWLEQRISEAETGDIGPGTDDPPSARPVVGIILEGGLVQSVVSTAPEHLPDLDLVILDYDVEGADADELLHVPQGDGATAQAVGRIESITQSDIDIEAVIGQMRQRGW